MSDTKNPEQDIPVTRGGTGPGGKTRQKIFNIIGWLAFALLAPPVLAMFKLPQLQELLSTRLGWWGSPIALVIYFYVVLFLRIFFGSDQRYTPVLIGYALSFLYFSIALDIGFMRWLYNLAHRAPFLSYDALNLTAGIIAIFLANALSGMKKAGPVIDAIVLGVLPAGGLIVAGIYLPKLLGL
ncbi:MAG: hypothetical protein RBT62_00515 [Spirochaetia bacterium]|jgi:hypothetical protein|nr:hypothetical protein [Spirochaetia bacterium]